MKFRPRVLLRVATLASVAIFLVATMCLIRSKGLHKADLATIHGERNAYEVIVPWQTGTYQGPGTHRLLSVESWNGLLGVTHVNEQIPSLEDLREHPTYFEFGAGVPFVSTKYFTLAFEDFDQPYAQLSPFVHGSYVLTAPGRSTIQLRSDPHMSDWLVMLIASVLPAYYIWRTVRSRKRAKIG
jgi:hypothetical protein